MGIVRRRTRRRMLLVAGGAAGAAYSAGKHRGQGEGGAEYDEGQEPAPQEPQYVPPAPPPPSPTAGDSDIDQIQKLAELHDAGTLSDEEFAAAKAKVLGM